MYASVNWTSIGSGNGLSPVRGQAITRINSDLLSTECLGTNFNEIWTKIRKFSFTEMRVKLSSAKWRPFCLGLDVQYTLTHLWLPWEPQVWYFCEISWTRPYPQRSTRNQIPVENDIALNHTVNNTKSLQWRHMCAMVSKTTGNSTLCSISFPGWQLKKHQSSAWLRITDPF